MRKTERFIAVYKIISNNGPVADFVTKKYASHRGVSKHDLSDLCIRLQAKADALKSGDKIFLGQLKELIGAEAAAAAEEVAEVATVVAAWCNPVGNGESDDVQIGEAV